jgi:hypothetical protein
MAVLYGRAGRLTAQNGGVWPGQSFEEPAAANCPADCDASVCDDSGVCGTGCGQNACASPALKNIAATCTAAGVGSADCTVANLAGVYGDETGATGYTVSYTSTGGELGFAAFWEPCSDSSSLVAASLPACDYTQDDKDNFGVISAAADGNTAWGAAGNNQHLAELGMFPDGAQVYMIDDTDGFGYVTVDTVDLAAYSYPTVSIWTHIDDTGYESADVIRVWVDCADGSTTDVVSGVLDDAAHPVGADNQTLVENMWIKHVAPLPATCGAATVSFGCQTNSDGEECWFDMVEIFDGDAPTVTPAMIIAGVLDLDLPDSTGKAIELKAVADVPDLSIYAVGVANNGGGTDGMEIETLPAISLLAGESHWLLRDHVALAAYFGTDSIFVTGTLGVTYTVQEGVSMNGDDAVELFLAGAVVDLFGDINVDGTGTAWEYKDSFATRNVDVSAPSAIFDQSQWTIAGYGPAGFVADESGDECSDGSTTSCDSDCGQYPSFPACPAPPPPPVAPCHQLACGGSNHVACNANPDGLLGTCVDNAEEHEVSCCADTEPLGSGTSGWVHEGAVLPFCTVIFFPCRAYTSILYYK